VSSERTTRRSPQEAFGHKLFAPTMRVEAIPRASIIKRIFENESARVFVLQGPAGHGKSTALQQIKTICEEQGDLCAWLTLDEADNDQRRLAIHLQALVNSIVAKIKDSPVSGGEPPADKRRERTDWMVEQLVKIDRPIALFFDDFQVLNNKSVMTCFRELVERVPANARFFIGSRSVPDLGLARLVVNQKALILRADDLRFSPAEVQQFFAASTGVSVSETEVSAIYRRTEGWPAALQLFKLTLNNPAVRKSLGDLAAYRPRELAEYLADNVLTLQRPRVQEFLLRTSLLQRLSGPLCDAVTGWHDSQEILLELEKTGLFLRSLDSDLSWFKYHALFSSFLAEQLRGQSDDIVREVHERAADWHLSQGMYEETVHHAIAARKFAMAADVMNIWLNQLVGSAQLITVERWYDRMPFEEIAKRPDLALKFAWPLIFLRRTQKLKPLLALLETWKGSGDFANTKDSSIALAMAAICADDLPKSFEIIGSVELLGRDPEGFSAFELSAGANLVGYRHSASSDFESARKFLALAHAYSERGDAPFSTGYTVGVRGITLLAQGQLIEALDYFRQSFAEQRMHIDKSFASAALVSCYIWALYEAGELEMVESLFIQYHDVITGTVLLDFLAVAYMAMARTHDARGRPAKALEILDEAEHIAYANGWQRLLRVVNWERVRRGLMLSGIDKARAIAATITPPTVTPSPDWIFFAEEFEGEAFGRVRLASHAPDTSVAVAMLTDDMAQHRNRCYRQIKLHLLDAQLQEKRGARNAAHRSLRKALQLGAPGRFVRCYLDEGNVILHLLKEEYQAVLDAASQDSPFGTDREHLERLLQASGTDLTRTAAPASVEPLEPLTDREKEILIFLANGVSNKEMAGRIFVSENTVKFHLKNIYSKLSVGSRLQAITAARQLGLLH
jgi:LuxR family maltose regulon positive regulatory protein